MARWQTGKAWPWFVAALFCIVLALGYCSGYQVPIRTHVATKPVPLYGNPEGMVPPVAPLVGEVAPGARCRFVQIGVAAEMMYTYRVICGELDGWTEEAFAFEPALNSYEPVQQEEWREGGTSATNPCSPGADHVPGLPESLKSSPTDPAPTSASLPSSRSKTAPRPIRAVANRTPTPESRPRRSRA